MRKFTKEQWWAISEYAGSDLMPLRELDTEEPFLYVRGWGAMYIPSGHHQVVLATLYAFENGLERAGDGILELDMCIGEMAEVMIEKEGVAWLSNVGNPRIQCASKLNYAERTYLKNVLFIGE